MRRTRILATVGPACDSAEGLRSLIDAGVDAFRLNFSHGTAEAHAEVCRRIREAARQAGRPVAVLQDLGGPKVRIGDVRSPIVLAAGDLLAIERGSFVGEPGRVSCAFEPLFASVSMGDRLLIDDGHLELEVTQTSPGRIETRVLTGGVLDSHKGINVPGAVLQTSALTPKDLVDIRAGVAMGVDMIAVSFVQTADDLRQARSATTDAGAAGMPLIAKIEKPQAVERIDEILVECDGLMVARGDLGVEMPLEALPAVQRQLIQAARRRGRPVVVATQVLESMRESPRPTRAEVTDAAHAVDQGADAIMLSGETAVGGYPRLAVATLDRIVREAERAASPEVAPDLELASSGHGRALCQAAVTLAAQGDAEAIVAVTGGQTAGLLAALRPRARVLAVTPTDAIAARLALTWGITPMVLAGEDLPELRRELLARSLVKPGSVVVFVAVHDALERDDANYVYLERL